MLYVLPRPASAGRDGHGHCHVKSRLIGGGVAPGGAQPFLRGPCSHLGARAGRAGTPAPTFHTPSPHLRPPPKGEEWRRGRSLPPGHAGAVGVCIADRGRQISAPPPRRSMRTGGRGGGDSPERPPCAAGKGAPGKISCSPALSAANPRLGKAGLPCRDTDVLLKLLSSTICHFFS